MKKLICLLLTLLSLDVMAQVTTASLRGVVVGLSNEALVGATISLTQSKTGVAYYSIADKDGRFAIHGIKPDDGYKLEASYLGYDNYYISDLTLRVGESRSVDIIMRENLASVGVVVVEADNAKSAGVGDNYSREVIESMPTVSRSLYDVVRLTPQANATKSGGMSYGGVANRYNSFMVNGMANNDMYGLSSSGTNGGLSNANPVSLDAIAQIEVAVASYDVRMSGFSGGMINAVTKSGTNLYQGSAYSYFSNQNLYGTTAGRDVVNREKLPQQTNQIYGVTFGGPIVKDMLFFFVSGEYNEKSSPSSYYLGYAGSVLSEEDLQRIASRYESLTGYDGGGVFGRDVAQRSGSLLANIDWHINSRNHLSLSYSYLDARAEEYANSLSSFTFVGSGYANYSTAHYLALSLESQLGDRVHNTLSVGFSRVEDGRKPDVEGDFPSVIIKNTGTTGGVTVNIGNNRYSGVNSLKQNVLTLTDNLIVERGSHSFTFGMHHELYNIHNLYLANAFGTYTYNSVADFEQDMAAMYEYNYTDPKVTGSTTWGPRFKAAELNVYAQDDWDMGRGFRLMYGVRATLPLIFNTPTPNAEFNGGEIARRKGIRIGDVPESQILFSPRVGLSWRRYYDKGVLSAEIGGGIFTGQVPFVWVVNNYSNTGVEQKGLRLTGKTEGGKVVESAAGFSTIPSPTSLSNTSFMLNAMDSKFRYPQNFKANAAVGYKSHSGWSARVETLYTKAINNVVFRNMAVEHSGEMVYAVSAADAAQGGAVPKYNKVTSDYSAIYYMENTSRGYSYSLSGSVAKSFDFGLSLSASYAFGHSYSVCDVPSTSSSTNWNRSYSIDLNNPELSFSSYDIPHKVSFAATYHKRYAELFDVTAGLVYQMTSGQRYSVTFGESVDFNGDGVFGSTLMYMPTEQELSTMQFADSESASRWNDYINSDSYLRSNRGSFAKRNALQAPAEHRIDLHLAHGFYFGGKSRRKVELSVDVMNFGNLLCRHWGSYYNLSGWRMQPVNVVGMENGIPVYKFTSGELSFDDLASRWHMQLGARIVF